VNGRYGRLLQRDAAERWNSKLATKQHHVMPDHRQKKIAGVEVDWKLATLLLRMWALGIRTSFSCQGDADSLGYIQFANAASAVKFYTTLPYKPSDPLFFEWHVYLGQPVFIVRFSGAGRKMLVRRFGRTV
jgi:hypothetical protein